MLLHPSADHYKTRIPQSSDVILVVEVSDSTLAFDQSEKLSAYGKAGIPEYRIVNRRKSVFEVYREPHFNGFSSKKSHAPGTAVCLEAFPDVKIEVSNFRFLLR